MKPADWKAYYDYRRKVLGRGKWEPGEVNRVRNESSPYVSIKFGKEAYKIPKAVVGAIRASGSKA